MDADVFFSLVFDYLHVALRNARFMTLALMELQCDDGLDASHPITIDLHLNPYKVEGGYKECTLDVSFCYLMFCWQAKRWKRLITLFAKVF